MLEDLIVAAWLVYGLTLNKPETEPHQTAAGVINTFKLHEFGWQKSRLIPNRLALEGENVTLDERIEEYCNIARKRTDELRPNLIILLGFVYLMSRDTPQDLMHQWVVRALKRHELSEDIYQPTANLILPDSKQIQ